MPVVNGGRHRTARSCKVIKQTQEEWQLRGIYAPLVHGEDVAAAGCLDQPIGVRDTFRDTLGRDQLADVIFRHQSSEIFRPQMSVDCHLLGELARQFEDHVLFGCGDRLFLDQSPFGKTVHDLAEEPSGRPGVEELDVALRLRTGAPLLASSVGRRSA